VTAGDQGQFAANLMGFARLLRAAGLPVGPGALLTAIEAVQAVGLADRRDFQAALHAVFVTRHDQTPLFDQAFRLFWRLPSRAVAAGGPSPSLVTPPAPGEAAALLRRLAEGLAEAASDTAATQAPDRLERDAALTFSAQERLQKRDFEQMSRDELTRAKTAIAKLRLHQRRRRTRRFAADPSGPRIDLRATLRSFLRDGGDLLRLKRRRPRLEPPPLVILCDISGSMSRYSRLFLHFMHAVANDRARVHTFLFGTRLTNITRHLRHRDVDLALDEIATTVEDWSGGTRIGDCLAEFNRLWSRRVLGQGASVLFISDGLDRAAGAGLGATMERLHKSCGRLIWLNPLLRWDGFEPKSHGMKAILPHVDELRPVHNLASLEALAEALARPAPRRHEAAGLWRQQA
jgi:uncharacterized protein